MAGKEVALQFPGVPSQKLTGALLNQGINSVCEGWLSFAQTAALLSSIYIYTSMESGYPR